MTCVYTYSKFVSWAILYEPIQEEWIHEQGLGLVRHLSMRRIIVSYTKASPVLAWRSQSQVKRRLGLIHLGRSTPNRGLSTSPARELLRHHAGANVRIAISFARSRPSAPGQIRSFERG